ncbi:response regulator [Piscinibacter sakaiensis]|uniref:Response regulator receiver protein n=1 Tax=Piscinibacter sakaiensis TaxID=1547922 RepID=A0A0K8P8L1_PISS1|nr:response regulator [Piscinibacter sakaiensis]GAP38530.1 response regulator receiver protein [Piscinibacter sakaiensis]
MATILVIEDEASIRDNLERILRLEGHRAIQAADGASGLRLIAERRPDLVLCDIMMPGLTGFEVLAALQADPALRGIPLLFVSASAEPEKLEEALRLGARGYLTKPFNLAGLREALRRHLPAAPPPEGS